jgi:hypothetical protein
MYVWTTQYYTYLYILIQFFLPRGRVIIDYQGYSETSETLCAQQPASHQSNSTIYDIVFIHLVDLANHSCSHYFASSSFKVI